MASELYLTWDDHHKSLIGVFEKLLDTNTLVDCTIAAEGQYLKAHKIILSACSPYFELLFSQENEKNPIVVLTDIKFQELKSMIDFIYRGYVKVPEECLVDFVDAAECLQIKGLSSYKHQEMSPLNTGNEIARTQRRRSCISPLPRKGMRPTDFGDGIERSDASPVNEVNFESGSFQESSCVFGVDASSSFRDETKLSISSATNSQTSLASSVCSGIKNLETTDSVPFVKSPLTQCEDVRPNPDSVVVKNEPEEEEDEEEYIPESECYFDPKDEEIEEDVELEGVEGETTSEPATNQFPGEDAVMQSAPPTHTTPLSITIKDEGSEIAMEQGGLKMPTRALTPSDRGANPPSASASSPPLPDVSASSPLLPPASTSTPHPPPTGPPLVTHTGDHPFQCEQCGKTFTLKGGLQKHLQVHAVKRPHRCELCGKTYIEKLRLQLHLLQHTVNGRRAAKGAVPLLGALSEATTGAPSSVVTGGRGDLEAAEDALGRDHPAGASPPAAASCAPSSAREKQRRFRCSDCGKRFHCQSDLERHHRTHTGERPFLCGECDRGFTRKGSLKIHMRQHTGKKSYRCVECGKHFTLRSSFMRHMRTHTGAVPLLGPLPVAITGGPSRVLTDGRGDLEAAEDPDHPGGAPPAAAASCAPSSAREKQERCRCPECGKGFKCPSFLVRHRRMHTGERPFLCNECGTGFTRKSSLKKHMSLHTGKLPYRSVECGKDFTRRNTFTRHMREHMETGNRISEAAKDYRLVNVPLKREKRSATIQFKNLNRSVALIDVFRIIPDYSRRMTRLYQHSRSMAPRLSI